jgi:hypothetical protein
LLCTHALHALLTEPLMLATQPAVPPPAPSLVLLEHANARTAIAASVPVIPIFFVMTRRYVGFLSLPSTAIASNVEAHE